MTSASRLEAEIRSIHAAVALYEDAVHTANPESFRAAFHPDTVLARPLVPGGPLVALSLDSYSRNAEELYDGAVPVLETTRKITVDVAGHVAIVRLDFSVDVGDESFAGTDFLNLAKIGGRWVVTYVIWDLTDQADDS